MSRSYTLPPSASMACKGTAILALISVVVISFATTHLCRQQRNVKTNDAENCRKNTFRKYEYSTGVLFKGTTYSDLFFVMDII
jgi:hypothetical protein